MQCGQCAYISVHLIPTPCYVYRREIPSKDVVMNASTIPSVGLSSIVPDLNAWARATSVAKEPTVKCLGATVQYVSAQLDT